MDDSCSITISSALVFVRNGRNSAYCTVAIKAYNNCSGKQNRLLIKSHTFSTIGGKNHIKAAEFGSLNHIRPSDRKANLSVLDLHFHNYQLEVSIVYRVLFDFCVFNLIHPTITLKISIYSYFKIVLT